jgi:hypothetical protein
MAENALSKKNLIAVVNYFCRSKFEFNCILLNMCFNKDFGVQSITVVIRSVENGHFKGTCLKSEPAFVNLLRSPGIDS